MRRRDDDSFIIISPHFIPGPLAGFGVDEIRPDEPVKFKPEPSAWVIKPLGGERLAYRYVYTIQEAPLYRIFNGFYTSIQVVGSPPGAIYAIDLERMGGDEEV